MKINDLPTQFELSMPFYGPVPCDVCKVLVVRTSLETGGRYFNLPDISPGQLYPNTPWSLHEHQVGLVERIPWT